MSDTQMFQHIARFGYWKLPSKSRNKVDYLYDFCRVTELTLIPKGDFRYSRLPCNDGQ